MTVKSLIYIITIATPTLAIWGCGDSSSSESQNGKPTGMSQDEYDYSRDRFHQEGFSNEEADDAARAVHQFNESQKNR